MDPPSCRMSLGVTADLAPQDGALVAEALVSSASDGGLLLRYVLRTIEQWG